MQSARLSYKLRRFGALPSADKWLLLRAVLALGLARAQLVFMPFPKLVERLSGFEGEAGADPELLNRVGYAVDAAAGSVPWRSDCFPRAIAAYRLLKRYGIGSTIHLGVERGGENDLLGHAWVTSGDTVVVGGAELDRYTEIHQITGK
jgi:hypothetical protein